MVTVVVLLLAAIALVNRLSEREAKPQPTRDGTETSPPHRHDGRR